MFFIFVKDIRGACSIAFAHEIFIFVYNMENRIRTIMEHEQMSQQEFAQKLGLSPATLSNIFNGKTRPTNNHVQAIHKAFPNINISWLLFGEGEMYISGTDSSIGGVADCSDASTPMTLFDDTNSYVSPPANGEEDSAFGRNEKSMSQKHGKNPSNTVPDSMQSRRSVHQISEINMSSNNVKIIDNRPRRIKEIRVFFDDGTYESFVPSR